MRKAIICVFTCALALGWTTVHAIDINVTGKGVGGLDGGISHGVIKSLGKGRKTLESSTSISRTALGVYDGIACTSNGVKGTGSVPYIHSTSIFTLENGNQLFSYLDDSTTYSICWNPTDKIGGTEIRRIFSGGTGAYSNACGYIDILGTSTVVDEYPAGTTSFTSINSTATGEVYLDPLDAPPGTPGCS